MKTIYLTTIAMLTTFAFPALAFHGVGTLQGTNPGPDGTLGTPDDYSVAISDN